MKIHRQPNACEECDLQSMCFAPAFSEESLHAISGLIQDCVYLKKYEMLYRQQDKFRGLYAVKSGAIKTF
ncbi:hypothetical protein ABTM52_20190, partial [Acinetobacter baumannii]